LRDRTILLLRFGELLLGAEGLVALRLNTRQRNSMKQVIQRKRTGIVTVLSCDVETGKTGVVVGESSPVVHRRLEGLTRICGRLGAEIFGG
jgi:hypothetical protein